jgi:hypothetical protein
MKSRHAAALALVGWYLMVTPLSKHGPNGKTAPLSQWEHPYTFDSRHDCETALAAAHLSEARGMAEVSLRTGLSEQESIAIPMDSIDWFCIATDDPRLKEK